jgi:hypothetical protein
MTIRYCLSFLLLPDRMVLSMIASDDDGKGINQESGMS